MTAEVYKAFKSLPSPFYIPLTIWYTNIKGFNIMSGSLNLKLYTVVADGTVTTNSTRIAGFTVTNKSATNNAGIGFHQLNSDGSVGSAIMQIDSLNSVGGNGNQITQTYSGNTGIYFENGIWCSVFTSCNAVFTAF